MKNRFLQTGFEDAPAIATAEMKNCRNISEVVHNEHSLALGFEVTAGRSRKFKTKKCCAERKRFVRDNLLPCQLRDQNY